VVVLLVLGMAFAVGNLWYTAARSTIPLELNGTIVTKQRRAEKWPGVDDVYLLNLNSGRRVQVDREVFDAVAERQTIRKQPWERTLEADGRTVPLDWSADLRGMLWAMPLTLLVCVAVGVMWRRGHYLSSGRGARSGRRLTD
jgi:hypothetical protein